MAVVVHQLLALIEAGDVSWRDTAAKARSIRAIEFPILFLYFLVLVGHVFWQKRLHNAVSARFKVALVITCCFTIDAVIQFATGKGDLSRMIAHGGGALGEDDAGIGAVRDGDQNGCIRCTLCNGKAFVAQQIGDVQSVALLEEVSQAVKQCAHTGSKEKVSPWLVTVQFSECAKAISANC